MLAVLMGLGRAGNRNLDQALANDLADFRGQIIFKGMDQQLQAQQIMRKATPVLQFDATVPEAIAFFRQQNTDFAAVQASADRYHGVLTEGGLMRAYLRFLAHPERSSLILYREFFEPPQLVHAKEPFAAIVKKLVTAVGGRVFVINDKTEVIGYITVRDVLPLLQQQPDGKQLSSEQSSDLYLYEHFFTQSPFMMHSVNREGEIRMANEMLHRVLGYDYGELVGKSVYDIYPQEVTDRVKESLMQIIDKGRFKVIQGEMVHKNGHRVPVEMVSRALADQVDHVIGTVTVSRPLDMACLLECLPQF